MSEKEVKKALENHSQNKVGSVASIAEKPNDLKSAKESLKEISLEANVILGGNFVSISSNQEATDSQLIGTDIHEANRNAESDTTS